MGRQRDSKLVGTVQNIIFYNLQGQYCMRAKPITVRRTESSVRSGLNFGKASKIGKQIRNGITPINPGKSDQRLMYRLTGALNKFMAWKEKKEMGSQTMPSKLPFIYRFQFNDRADLSSIRAIEPIVKFTNLGVAELNFAPLIPSQSLQAPLNAVGISLKMVLISTNLNDTQTRVLGKSEMEIPNKSETFQIPPLNVVIADQTGNLAMLIMSVQYLVKKNGETVMITDRKKQPIGIVWAGII